VGIEDGVADLGGLTVEAGRQRFADRFASHGVGVARLGRLVPAEPDLDVDDLTALAMAAAEGDRVAMTAFVRGTQPEVWRVCARLGDRVDADDLTQEVYLRALPALERFRGDASARTWLLQIARHVCADHVRRSTRRRALADRVSRRTSEVDLVEAPRTGELDLEDAIQALSSDRREAFVLTQITGLSYAEAAEVCAVPIGTIRSRVARARADLLDAIADDADDWGSARP
jgi:RNA polymerase sigma-70 factor (ECF subfamily)